MVPLLALLKHCSGILVLKLLGHLTSPINSGEILISVNSSLLILKTFCWLLVLYIDSNNSIPSIYCEAGELYKLPPISLHPLAEQVEKNSQVLTNLTSAVQCLETKLSSCFLTTTN